MLDLGALKTLKKWRSSLSFQAKTALNYCFVAGILLASLAAFGLFEARQQDRNANEYASRAIEAAIQARAQSFGSWVKGYSLWDDIYRRMVLAEDIDWANENIGPGVWKTFTVPMSGIYIIDDREGVRYQYWSDRSSTPVEELFVNLAALRARADASENPAIEQTVIDSKPHFIGVGRIRPMDDGLRSPSDPKRYMILIQPIHGRMLVDIGASMNIGGLRWVPSATSSTPSSIGGFGPSSGRIVWDAHRPGHQMLQSAWLPGLGLIFITVSVGIFQFYVARRLNRLLYEKQSEAETESEKSRAASKLADRKKNEAATLISRLQERENALARLSHDRDVERAQRDARDRAQSLNLLLHFERDFSEVLAPVSAIAEQLASQSVELEQGASAGRIAAATVLEAANRSKRAIETVVEGKEDLQTATSDLDANVTAAVLSTKRAEHTIEDLINRLSELSANTTTVEGVVSIVADLAARINMLAMNARIEAARSGEAGRGFAVVANEVKQLAELTGSSAKSITEVLGAIQEQAQTAGEGIQSIRGVVAEISTVISSSRSALSNQHKIADGILAAVEIVRGRISDTDTAIRNLDRVVGSSEETSTSLTAAADELRARSRLLRARSIEFADGLRQDTKSASVG